MKTNGQEFIEELAGFPPGTFESKFSGIAARLHLDAALNRTDLERLFEASLLAVLCNTAFSVLGRCGGIREFMAARDKVYASAGWKALPPFVRNPIQGFLLHV
jgi:hypothetical protein